jgi:sialate O-acetylesterase
MISPVTSFSIAGALWYQGESNTNTYSSYQQLFTEMIKSWRKAWKIDFPFYYVQIAPFYYGNKHVGSLLQEQQTKTLQLQGTGMVVITDLVDNVKDIHPKDKLSVADRLANMALAETYQKKIAAFKSPQFTRMVITKGKAHLFFTDAPNGFIIKGDNKAKATEFYIAGVDEKFLPAEVKVEKDRVVLFNKLIKDPVAVRFAFSNTAMANLFSKEIRPDGSVVSGLPVTPFRTDTWEVNTEKIDQ